jgi:hypothetical protein
MDITGILRNLRGVVPTDLAAPADKRAEAPVPVSAERGAAAVSPQAQQALREVVSRYDVTHISPRDFSQLIQELRQAGAITAADQEELALVRLELDQQGADPDEPIDLVDFLQRKLQTQEREIERMEAKQGTPIDRAVALKETLRQIDWISKFALVHQSGSYQPLDTVA